jgi:rRNA maturation RNase YbeY
MKEPEIAVGIDCPTWLQVVPGAEDVARRAAAAALASVPARLRLPEGRKVEVAIQLSDDVMVQGLNRDWRGKDEPTNVLSFASLDDDGEPDVPGAPLLLGDLILAFETCAVEAVAEEKTLADHLAHLVVHGVLHLAGYDHQDDADATVMEAAETAILARLVMNETNGSSPQPKTWLRFLRRGKGGESVREALEELIEEREGDEVPIDDNERLLLANILHLRDVTASDLMVPRVDIIAIESRAEFDSLPEIFTKCGHSRLPVYRKTLDDVAGMIHIKDVMAAARQNQPVALMRLVRRVMFVAPSMRALDLLLEMRLKRTHMALVVDEYGGIDGLVTIEDVVEQIVGEIEDEHDRQSEPDMAVQPDGVIVADARTPVAEFEALVGPVLTDEEREDIDTLGGLVSSIAGRVPARGELIAHPSGTLEFEVVDADPRRLRRVRVRRLTPDPAPESA